MIRPRSEFRECLFCFKELPAGSLNTKNFCNGTCNWKFKEGMPPEKYREECEKNRLIPIRPLHTLPERERRRVIREGNTFHRICKLGEFKDRETGEPLCNNKFSTEVESKVFCSEGCRIKYNSIQAKQRRHKKQAEKAIELKRRLEELKENSN